MDEENKKMIKIESRMMEVYLGLSGNNLAAKSFPRKVNYWLARIFDKLKREFRIYLNQRDEIVQKYYDADKSAEMPDGHIYIPPNNRIAYNKEANDLDKQEIEINICKIEIDEEDLPKDLTVKDYELLLPILDIKWKDKKQEEK